MIELLTTPEPLGAWMLLSAIDWATVLPVLVTLVAVAFVAIVGWTSGAITRKRSRQFEQAAGELSLLFQAEFPSKYAQELGKYPLFQVGSERRSVNAITADSGDVRLVIFDYHYATGSGKNKTRYKQTVAWVLSRELEMPDFNLSPESWLSRIGDLLTKSDIDFADDAEFSKKFVLTGSDPAAVASFFNPVRRQALLKIKSPRIEAASHAFIFYRPRHRIAPSDVKTLMSEAFLLYQTFRPS